MSKEPARRIKEVEANFKEEWIEGGQFGFSLEDALCLNFRLIGILVAKGVLTEEELADLQNTWLES